MLFCIPKHIWMDFNWSIIYLRWIQLFFIYGIVFIGPLCMGSQTAIQWSIRRDFTAYGILSLITTLGILLFTYLDIYPLYAMFIRYSSPLIIAAALFLLLAFSKLSLSNTFINKVAASCFAVYLFHFILFPQYMRGWIQSIASEYAGVTMAGLILALLLGFYATAILIDQVRIMVWNFVSTRYFSK